MMNPDLSLNPFGRLVLVTPDGVSHEGVTPVRAFPVAGLAGGGNAGAGLHLVKLASMASSPSELPCIAR